jgi:hypothetical protein
VTIYGLGPPKVTSTSGNDRVVKSSSVNIKSKVQASSATVMTQAVFTKKFFASVCEIYISELY